MASTMYNDMFHEMHHAGKSSTMEGLDYIGLYWIRKKHHERFNSWMQHAVAAISSKGITNNNKNNYGWWCLTQSE